MNIFLNDIKTELERINRQHWMPTLQQLINHYDGIKGIEAINMPQQCILDVLESLDDDPKINISAIFKFQRMSCFSYRVYRIAQETQFWNPLEKPFSEFQKNATDVQVYQSEQPHPADDIIRRWFAERLIEQEQTNNKTPAPITLH